MRPDPHPCRRADQGSRRLPRLVAASGRSNADARQFRRLAALDCHSCHPHDGGGDRRGWRVRGAIAGLCPTTEANLGDGIFPAGGLHEGRRRHRHRLRQPHHRFARRGPAHAGIFAAPARPHPQCAGGRSRPVDRAHAVRCASARAVPRSMASRSAPSPPAAARHRGARRRAPALIGRSGDAALDTWIFSGGNRCVKDVFVAGIHVVKDRHHIHEEQIARSFRAAVRRLDSMIRHRRPPARLSTTSAQHLTAPSP